MPRMYASYEGNVGGMTNLAPVLGVELKEGR